MISSNAVLGRRELLFPSTSDRQHRAPYHPLRLLFSCQSSFRRTPQGGLNEFTERRSIVE